MISIDSPESHDLRAVMCQGVAVASSGLAFTHTGRNEGTRTEPRGMRPLCSGITSTASYSKYRSAMCFETRPPAPTHSPEFGTQLGQGFRLYSRLSAWGSSNPASSYRLVLEVKTVRR